MLYTQQSKTSHLSKKYSKNFFYSLYSQLIASVLMLSAISLAQAENMDVLVIPTYDNTILNDGYARWNQTENSQGYVIHSSILFDNLEKKNNDSNQLTANEPGRNDRTSSHLPITFNITMKGYSVYEVNDKFIKRWSFDKINLNLNKKPELFFGVQKPFF